MKDWLYIIFGILCLCIIGFLIGCGIVSFFQRLTTEIEAEPLQKYRAQFDNHGYIYDGDTLIDMAVRISDSNHEAPHPNVLWPGIVEKGGSLYVITDLRIFGIDTPEKRPTRAGRTADSIAAEKEAAAVSTETLRLLLLSDADAIYDISNIQLRKYAGRVLADISVVTETGEQIDVATYMIKKRMAVPYLAGLETARLYDPLPLLTAKKTSDTVSRGSRATAELLTRGRGNRPT